MQPISIKSAVFGCQVIDLPPYRLFCDRNVVLSGNPTFYCAACRPAHA
ncbi:hypothetical protein Q7O_001077 [Pectobacterium carotovorum subsp. carotovorum PCCS1]|nr:hypothetical protein [Pectobacterium carotovorum subsp. carotovorum PCCS1]